MQWIPQRETLTEGVCSLLYCYRIVSGYTVGQYHLMVFRFACLSKPHIRLVNILLASMSKDSEAFCLVWDQHIHFTKVSQQILALLGWGPCFENHCSGSQEKSPGARIPASLIISG